MKKLMTLVAVSALALTAFTGCQKKASTGDVVKLELYY